MITLDEAKKIFSDQISEPQLTIVANQYLRKLAAHDQVKAIPNWATWAQADWATFYNANLSQTQITAITSLAEAKLMIAKQNTVLDAIVKMVLALRDNIWPDLPD